MAETSKIEWTDSTFNPWIGRTIHKISNLRAHGARTEHGEWI